MIKFLIVDGNSIANRAFYALPFLTNHEGKPSGAVYGFANILIKIISEQKPTHVAVAFDHARKTFRNDIYPEYKGQRKPTPEELVSQFPIIKQMLNIMGISTFEFENIEADDIIGTLSRKAEGEKILLSGDRDLLQLINKSTSVWLTKKGVTEVAKVGIDDLKLDFGLEPSQVIELKGLMGDTSDNIPGVKGIGEKTAKDLLEKYHDIDNIYNCLDQINGKLKEKLQDGKSSAYMSKTLATIKCDCDFPFDLDECKFSFPLTMEVADFFKSMDFASLLKNPHIFSGISINHQNKVQKEELSENIINEIIKSQKPLAYDLKKMNFSISEDKIYFLTSNYDMFGSALSLQDVCKKLSSIFENKNILKLTTNAKEDMHFFDKLGIKLNNYVDINLESYVINAGLKSDIDAEVNEYFDIHSELEKKMANEGVDKIYNDIEFPLIEILKDMEDFGFKVDYNKIIEIDNEYSSLLNGLTKEIYKDAGEEFNINSPKQVATILFDKLGIKTYNNKKRSTSIDILDDISFIPIVQNILHYRKLAKLKNTYIDVYKQMCQNNGDIIHTTFNQTVANTGRLSSSEPNLQTIPTRNEEGRELRKIFTTRFEGGNLVSADYNQIELRLLAHMSGEQNLIEAYREGKDIHTITASQIFGTSEEKVTSGQRRDAKAVNFGIIYGISDYGLSQNIKSSRATAKDYISSYFERYPAVKSFMDENVAKATKDGYIKTIFGRIRRIPELSSSKYQTRSFGERVAMNMPLQGTASDIIKLAMIKVFNAFKTKGLKSKLILQIHDELIVDAYPGEVEKVCAILKEEMENVISLQVPLVVSIGYGKNLYDCK